MLFPSLSIGLTLAWYRRTLEIARIQSEYLPARFHRFGRLVEPQRHAPPGSYSASPTLAAASSPLGGFPALVAPSRSSRRSTPRLTSPPRCCVNVLTLFKRRGDRAYPSTDAPCLTPKPNTSFLTRQSAHSRSALTDILLSVNNLDIGRPDCEVNPERFRAS